MGLNDKRDVSILAFERYDPTDKSLAWLGEQGVRVKMGHPLWEMPFKRFTGGSVDRRGQRLHRA